MIKFRIDKDKPLIGLGLSTGNLEHLKKGEPIIIRGAEVGTSYDIMIFWGETELVMCKELHRGGFLSDQDFEDIMKHTVDGELISAIKIHDS